MPHDAAVPGDTKDWTWVLTRPCEECGFDPGDVDVRALGPRIDAACDVLCEAATAPDGDLRPRPGVWSPVEYACHVVDACDVFAGRVAAMRRTDGVRFADWDQDAAALAGRYAERAAVDVVPDLRRAAARATAAFAAVGPGEWSHRGVRSNGSEFTVATIAPYFLHDLEHHAHDVGAQGSWA